MPRANEFVSYLLELLAPLGNVRARAMFGGFGLYVEDQMFGLVADEVIYIKADDLNRKTFESAGMQPFRLESKNAVMSYYTIPDEALDDGDVMCEWARMGVEAASRKRKPARAKSKARKRL